MRWTILVILMLATFGCATGPFELSEQKQNLTKTEQTVEKTQGKKGLCGKKSLLAGSPTQGAKANTKANTKSSLSSGVLSACNYASSYSIKHDNTTNTTLMLDFQQKMNMCLQAIPLGIGCSITDTKTVSFFIPLSVTNPAPGCNLNNITYSGNRLNGLLNWARNHTQSQILAQNTGYKLSHYTVHASTANFPCPLVLYIGVVMKKVTCLRTP